VRAKKNILITGGTGAGKTTLLRALASEMDAMERIVTIEDAFELGLELDPDVHADVTAFQARDANVEGEGAISQAELVRWGLRMSPDRVIVGEIRGPEVIPMCNAMSQGNDGSMATLHASSSRIAFTRLASYAAQGVERLPLDATNLLVASAVHFVVHLARGTDRTTRVVSSIREVVGADGPQVVSNEVYRPGPDRRARPMAGALRTDTLDDLVDAGFDPGLLEQPEGWWPR
jgi:pilus assembly protein CpaF